MEVLLSLQGRGTVGFQMKNGKVVPRRLAIVVRSISGDTLAAHSPLQQNGNLMQETKLKPSRDLFHGTPTADQIPLASVEKSTYRLIRATTLMPFEF